MSLINQMLNDLESRQADSGLRQDHVLSGLKSSTVYRAMNYRSILYSLLMGALCITAYLYFNLMYLNNADNNGVTFQIVSPPLTADIPDKTPVNTQMENTEPEIQQTSTASTDNFPSLKLDSYFLQETDITDVISKSDISKVEIDSIENGISINVNFKTKPKYYLYTLNAPYRLVFELYDIHVSDELLDDMSYLSHDLIKATRIVHKKGLDLLVYELNEDMVIQDSRMVETKNGAELHVQLLFKNNSVSISENITEELLPIEPEIQYTGLPASDVQFKKVVHKEDKVKKTQDYYQEGIRFYREDNPVNAIERLYMALNTNPAHAPTIKALASVLIEQGDIQGAEKILNNAIDVIPVNSDINKLYAKLLQDRGESDKAISYLMKGLPDMKSDPDYHALLAAALQQQGKHIDAVNIYKGLVALRPNQGIWWMGMAISFEALGQKQYALSAYIKAKQTISGNSDVTPYINQRIEDLSKHAS